MTCDVGGNPYVGSHQCQCDRPAHKTGPHHCPCGSGWSLIAYPKENRMSTTAEVDEMFTNVQPYKEDEPPQKIARDRWGRPIIRQPDGKGLSYMRASTLAGALDDKTALGDWKARLTGRGVAISPDLIAGLAALQNLDDPEQKKTANELVEQAQERAGSTTKRTLGTAFHNFSEMYDKGQKIEHLPDALKPLLRNYAKVTYGVCWLAIEQFVVVDEIQTAGTADRVGQRKDWDKPKVWDVKTGRVDYGQMKFAVQLAVYARGSRYNPETGERSPWPSVDLETGIILHADPVTGVVEPYEVDLDFGWWAAQEAKRVMEGRKRKDIMRKVSWDAPPSATQAPQPDPAAARAQAMQAAAQAAPPPTILQRLAACTSLDEIRAIYAQTGSQWGPSEKQTADTVAAAIRNKNGATS